MTRNSAGLKLRASYREHLVQDFNLSLTEKAEVEALNYKIGKLDSEKKIELKKLAETTANAGVQYVLLDIASFIPIIMSSSKLDPKVVPPFLDQLTRSLHLLRSVEVSQGLEALLKHKVVVADAKLFKQTWEANQASQALSTAVRDQTFYESLILMEALDTHSMAPSGHENRMSIPTLFFILGHLETMGDQNIIFDLKNMRAEIMETRMDEIKAWINEKMPDLGGLPLSWILEVYDLYLDL